MTYFVVGLLAQAFGPNVLDEKEAVGKISVVLLSSISSVILLLPLAILGAAAVFDVLRHALLSFDTRSFRVVCAFEIRALFCFEHRLVFAAVLQVVGALFCHLVGFGLVEATTKS